MPGGMVAEVRMGVADDHSTLASSPPTSTGATRSDGWLPAPDVSTQVT